MLQGGPVVGRVYKHDLPNYGVFDEKRVFAAGPMPGPVRLPLRDGDIRLGVMVCEDMWTEDVAEGLAESGASCSWCSTARPSSTASRTSACSWQ